MSISQHPDETGCCSSNQPQYQKLDHYISELPDKKGQLINVLHQAQSLFGYLPREVQQFVATKMGESLASVYGVVSFYTYFSMVPCGKYQISICMGTACFIKNAEDIVDAFKQQLKIEIGVVTEDGLFSIDTVRCIGACGLAPVVTVGDKVFSHVTVDQVADIIAEFSSSRSTAA